MDTLKIKGSWNEIQGKLKQKYAQLTDNDLMFTEGKEEELLGRIQKRIGKSKDEIKREIESLGFNTIDNVRTSLKNKT